MKVTLKELRARANITQAQMAKRIGVNSATYNSWEALSVADICKIAEMFGIEVKDIEIPRNGD